jgi:hypothetical protein
MSAVDRTVTIDIDVDPAAVMAVMADLTTYPEWMGLVHRVETTEPAPGGRSPAYLVDLRARLGPVARSKRLRMVRADLDPGRSVRFEREEVSGRDTSQWVMAAEAEEGRLSVRLRYDGHLWARALEQALELAIRRDRPRLLALAHERQAT